MRELKIDEDRPTKNICRYVKIGREATALSRLVVKAEELHDV